MSKLPIFGLFLSVVNLEWFFSRFFKWLFRRFFYTIQLGPIFPGRPIFIQFVPVSLAVLLQEPAQRVLLVRQICGREFKVKS